MFIYLFVSFMASPPTFFVVPCDTFAVRCGLYSEEIFRSRKMRTDDGSIIYECLNGEPGAFGVLVDKYKEGIYVFVYSKLRNFQDAQDVTQEVFLQAYRGLRSLRRWESFGFWLYRIAYARCSQWLRINSRRVDREFIEDQDSSVIDDGSLGVYRDGQLSQSLQEALDSLPEMHREVLMLRYFAGMNSKEIARVTGTSPGAIRMRLSRARAQLREEMADMMDTAFEGQRIPAGFTLRIIEAVKRIKIHPMPRATALPWGLSVAVGIIITVMSLNPQMSITSDLTPPTGSPLPVETKVLKTGEIPVDILDVSRMPLLAIMQGKDDGGEPDDPQKAVAMLAQGEGGKWTQKADMQIPRCCHSVCVVDGEIYAIGGFPTAKGNVVPIHSTAEKYNPETDTWVNISNMPFARWGHTANAVDGKIYVIGGDKVAGIPCRVVPMLIYDVAKGQWSEKDDVPIGFGFHCSAVVNGKIYLIGGVETIDKADIAVSRVYEYDPKADMWTRKADMPTARFFAAAGVVNGKIYVVGGGEPQYNKWPWNILSTMEEYDPVTDTWTQKADMPTPRSNLSVSVVDGRIYAMGGRDREGINAVLSTVEEYDPKTDKWRRVADMPSKKQNIQSSVVNGKVYTIGGSGGQGTLSTVEEYTPEDWQPESVSPQGKLPTKWGEVKSD